MLEDLKLGPRYDGFLFLAEAARNPPILRPHHHLELELNLVVSGSITYVVGGRRFSFSRRTILWMFPSQEHQLVDRTKDAQYFVAVFKPALIAASCKGARYAGLKRAAPEGAEGEPRVLHAELAPDRFELLRQTMAALVEDGLDPDLLNREAGFGAGSDFQFQHGDPDWLNAGLRHLLLLSWREQQGREGASRAVVLHPAVKKALALLADGDWGDSLARLARTCAVSEAYLSRTFARQIGASLTRYRNSARLARFWRVYRESDRMSFTEAMSRAGFGSYPQFYKVFVEAYGHGPREVLHGGQGRLRSQAGLDFSGDVGRGARRQKGRRSP